MITIQLPNEEQKKMVLVKRFDKNLFVCKESNKHRSTVFVAIEYIKDDVDHIPYDQPILDTFNGVTIDSEDERDGIIQAAEIGLKPSYTIMCSNPKLNQVN